MYNRRKLQRFTALILTIALIFLLTGCGDDAITSEKVDTESLQTLYTANQAVVTSAGGASDIAAYIDSWARGNDNFKVSHDKYDNVIVSLKATEGYKDADSTILHCTLEPDNPSRTALGITSIMYIMEHSHYHGFIRALFTAPDEGITKVKETYIKADNFISLDWSKNNDLMIGSAGRNTYHAIKEISYQKPSYPNAYRITIMGLEPTMASKTNQLNAVKTLGKLLAELKSVGTLIEVGDFNSGFMADDGTFVADEYASDEYPLGASALVLVNDNDVSKLTKKIEKSQSKVLENYSEANPNLVYEMTQIEDVSGITQILSSDDTSTLISFIYTCPCGTYEKDDEGEITSLTNILSCNTKDGTMCFNLCSVAKDTEVLSGLDELFQTLCGLYDLTETMEKDSPVMNIENYEEMPLIKTLTEISTAVYDKETKYDFGFDNTSAAKLLGRIPDANIAVYGITEKNLERQLETILTFFEQNNIE